MGPVHCSYFQSSHLLMAFEIWKVHLPALQVKSYKSSSFCCFTIISLLGLDATPGYSKRGGPRNWNFQCNVLTMLAVVVPKGLRASAGNRLAGNRLEWGKGREDRSAVQQLLQHSWCSKAPFSKDSPKHYPFSLVCHKEWLDAFDTVPFYSSMLRKGYLIIFLKHFKVAK